MEEENRQPTGPDDVAEPQAESAEERRLAQIMHRIAQGDTSVTSEVYWMQLLEGSAKRGR
jgi:hypothetical protein